MEAVLLVRAVAERLVRRAAAAAERSPFALVENAAFGVEDAHTAGDEQWSVRRCTKLERLPAWRRRDADPARSQGSGRTARNCRLDLVGRRSVTLTQGRRLSSNTCGSERTQFCEW